MGEIVITILLCITLVIVLIIYRKLIHYGGQIVITTNEEGKKVFILELDKDPSEIESLNSIRFKIVGEKSAGYEKPN